MALEAVELNPQMDESEKTSNSDVPNVEFRQFALWALQSMHLRVDTLDHGDYTVHAPEDQKGLFHGAQSLRFRFEHLDTSQQFGERPAGVIQLAPGQEMFQWLCDRFNQNSNVHHARPERQPVSFQEVSPSLLAPFVMSGGEILIEDGQLIERPLLRLTYLVPKENVVSEEEQTLFFHRYVDENCTFVRNELVTSLELGRLRATHDHDQAEAIENLDDWIQDADSMVLANLSESGHAIADRHPELVAVTVVWCTWATGELMFSTGDTQLRQAFEGWAQHFVDQEKAPPQFRCPKTGKESYQIACTDDAEISVSENLAECEESGKRVFCDELVHCEITERNLLPQFMKHCPVTDRLIDHREIKTCSQCWQGVSSKAIHQGRCKTCNSLTATPKTDTIIAGILAEYPELSRWSKWRTGESTRYYVVSARSFTQQACFVFEKESLAVLHAARKPRFWGDWEKAE